MASSPQHDDAMMEAPVPRTGKPPITANPAFRWIMALWFAALLGAGSLIVPVSVLERLVLASGIASVMPMAAPPLGLTARALVALAGAIIGALIGLVLARRLAKPKKKKQLFDASSLALAPLGPEEDLGEPSPDPEDTLPASTTRRRALAMSEEESDNEFPSIAPLPGEMEPQASPTDDVQTEDIESPADAEPGFGPDSRHIPEQQDAIAEPPHEAEGSEGSHTLVEISEAQPLDLDPADVAGEQLGERQEFIVPSVSSQPVIDIGYDNPAPVRADASQPLPFSPPSMARQNADGDSHEGMIDPAIETSDQPQFVPDIEAGKESEDIVSDNQIFEGREAIEPDFATRPAPAEIVEDEATHDVDQQEQDANAQSDAEGLVQLVQRLSATLEKHREWSAAQAARKPAVQASITGAADAPLAEEFDTAAAEEAARARADYFGRPAGPDKSRETVPDFSICADSHDAAEMRGYASLTGIGAHFHEDEEEDDVIDLSASLALPLARAEQRPRTPRPAFDQPPPSAASHAEGASEENADVPGSAAAPFNRNDEPEPAVLFPSQANRQPADDENERALREALMNLQRMGK